MGISHRILRKKPDVWGKDSGGISTRNLGPLPDIDDLRKLCQSIATLEAIISPEWQWRYYSFDSKWGPGAMCASMRNGSGDDFYIIFSAAGAIIKGFAHEYVLSPWSPLARAYHGGIPGLWPGVIDRVPPEFGEALTEPAIEREATTFCVWRKYGESTWNRGDIDFPEFDYVVDTAGVMHVGTLQDPDGSNRLLSILDGDPRSYKNWADDYYVHEDGKSRNFDLPAIEYVYLQRPLTDAIVQQLNPELNWEDLEKECVQIGYPR